MSSSSDGAPVSEASWDLEALVSQVASQLAAVAGPSDGRVASLPDARAVRYYQTLGMVSRPLRYDGRQAVYGHRHLLELLAIKRLQAAGYSLAQIQRALTGATLAALEAAGAAPQTASAPEIDISNREAMPFVPRRVMAVEVAPGVTLSIDPERVADPERVLLRVQEALGTGQGGSHGRNG
jgi:DNA-binding transcriptional MerR regulator